MNFQWFISVAIGFEEEGQLQLLNFTDAMWNLAVSPNPSMLRQSQLIAAHFLSHPPLLPFAASLCGPALALLPRQAGVQGGRCGVVLGQLIYIDNLADMGFNIGDVFGRIPESDFERAVNSGLLLSAAVSIFYIFFGRLLSLPELLSVTLRAPASELSRKSLIIISGLVFVSALLRTLYHEHLTSFYPYDDQNYLQKISTLRLIVSGTLVGLGAQYKVIGREGTGTLGIPTLSLRSMLSTVVLFASIMGTVTLQLHRWIPATPRLLQIANQSLPSNISFDAYLLVTLLVPFICFLIAPKKSLKGMIESLLLFGIGISVGVFLMLLGWSEIQTTFKLFRYSKNWTANIVVAFTVASSIFAVVFLIVKYGFKKPLFSNELQDKKAQISLKMLAADVLFGVGFGLGGLIFESFLLTVPSSELRMLVFWGLPCIFAMKGVQVLSDRSSQQKKE